MAKLPTYRDLGPLPSARSGAAIASPDLSAIGRGVAHLGQGISEAGAAVGRISGGSGGGLGNASQAERFETNRRFLEFASARQQELEEGKNSVDPGAFGFRERVQTSYMDAAKEFFSSVPQALKPEYDQKLFVVEDSLLGKSYEFEKAERTRYYGEEVNKGLSVIENDLYTNPDNFDRNLSEGIAFIEAIPDENVSKIAKADMVRQWRTKAQVASLGGVNPQERIRLLGGVPDVEQEPSAARGQSVTRGIPGDVRKTISDAASKYGVDPNALLTIAWLESRGNPNAKNPKSSAGGLFQFIDSTARDYGLENKFDAAASADAGARLARDNSAGLQNALGRPPTVGELYLAHQQGLGGAIKLLTNPTASAADLVGADAVRLNGGKPGMTAGEFAGLWLKKAGDAGTIGRGMRFDAARADPRYADLSYVDGQKVIDGALAEIKQANVETRGYIEVVTQNAPTAILNTGQYDNPLPTAQQFMDAYGPQEGAQRFNAFQTQIETASQAHDMRTMSAAEIQQMVAAATPTSTGDNAALETQRYQTLSAAAQTTLKAREDDPGLYVRQTFPNIKQAWDNVSTGADYQAALALTAAAQQNLGISTMRLLPDDHATAAVEKFKDATLPEAKRLETAMHLVMSTQDKEQQRAVFNQLVEAGLPDMTEGAFEAMARGDSGAAKRLFQAAMINPDELPGALPEKKAVIADTIQSELMDEGEIGDIYYGLSDGNVENFARAERDNKLMMNAVILRMKNGEALSDAIAGVSRDLYGDVKVVDGDRRVNARLLLPQDQDETAVLDGLDAVMPDVRAAVEGALALPEDLATADSTKPILDAVTQNYAENVLSEGYFRNYGDGFIFHDPYTAKPIPGPDGMPLVFTVDMLAAAPRPAAPNTEEIERRFMEDRANQFGIMGGSQ